MLAGSVVLSTQADDNPGIWASVSDPVLYWCSDPGDFLLSVMHTELCPRCLVLYVAKYIHIQSTHISTNSMRKLELFEFRALSVLQI